MIEMDKSEAARMMGRSTSAKKAAASRANALLGAAAKQGRPVSPETRERLRAAQSARRSREQEQKQSNPQV